MRRVKVRNGCGELRDHGYYRRDAILIRGVTKNLCKRNNALDLLIKLGSLRTRAEMKAFTRDGAI